MVLSRQLNICCNIAAIFLLKHFVPLCEGEYTLFYFPLACQDFPFVGARCQGLVRVVVMDHNQMGAIRGTVVQQQRQLPSGWEDVVLDGGGGAQF
jgi:hypothetical protein